MLLTAADWTDRLSRTLESYDEALLRQVAGKLCKPRNQWPVEELLGRCLATFDNPPVLDRRLADLSEAARTVLALIGRSRQPRWAVGNLVEMLGTLGMVDGFAPIVELLHAGLLFPDQFTRSATLPRVKTFDLWLGQASGAPSFTFVHPAVIARALQRDLTLPECPGQVLLPKAPVQESDGLDWLLRVTALWQQVSGGSLRRTQSGDFFKRDLDRLRSDPLLTGAGSDHLAEVPDPGLLVVSLALGIGLLVEENGELRVGQYPASWENGLSAALADLWANLLRIATWNPVQGWQPGAPLANPYPSLYMLSLMLLSRLPEDGWARPGELDSWFRAHHPYWAGAGKRPSTAGTCGVEAFLLGLAHPLRLVQATREGKQGWLVRLSPMGKWLLGMGPQPSQPAFPQTLLVQPNLEILVYRQGLNPSLLARLARFASWKGLGAALTMQLTPESIYLGLEAGESFQTISQTLDRHGMKPTPETVVNALRTWANKRDRIQVYTAGALFEFNSEADLTDALARGLNAVRLGDRLAIVAQEKDIDFRHFRLIGTRDYGLPPERCVEVDGDGVTLAVDLARSDLLIETEVQRFAEPIDRTAQGRRFFRLTPASAASGRSSGLSLQTLEVWFPQRCGIPLPAAARLLYAATNATSPSLRSLLVLEVAYPEMADGLLQWPSTRTLINGRLGPTALIVAAEHVDALRERLAELGMELEGEKIK